MPDSESNSDDSWDDPVNDDDDSSSGDDPFTFQKHAFRKKRVGLDEESSTWRGGTKRKDVSISDKALEQLERRQEKTSLKRHFDNAHEEDSDLEIVPEAPSEKKAKVDVFELSSDEEDSDNTTGFSTTISTQSSVKKASLNRTNNNMKVCRMLMEAKRARSQLAAAQHYHAEDVHVPEPVVDLTSIEATTALVGRTAATAAPTSFGPPIRVSLRTSQIVHGRRQHISTDVMSVRQREPFQYLLERYRREKGIALHTKVTFSFDGERIDWCETPMKYELQDDDLVDTVVEGALGVVIATRASLGQTFGGNTVKSMGATLALKLRTQQMGKNRATTQDVMTIREHEPFQKLLEKYKKEKKLGASSRLRFEFDGDSLDFNKTPKSYDMEDDDIIDIKLSR